MKNKEECFEVFEALLARFASIPKTELSNDDYIELLKEMRYKLDKDIGDLPGENMLTTAALRYDELGALVNKWMDADDSAEEPDDDDDYEEEDEGKKEGRVPAKFTKKEDLS